MHLCCVVSVWALARFGWLIAEWAAMLTVTRSLQAIIFQNGRAIGRSVNLKLYSCTLPESSLYKSEESLAIECFALQLDAWHPSWKARTEDSSPLYIAVDEDFKKSSFHVQLIGRTSRGTNFALPFAYKFEGSAVCSRLEYYDQHVKRHQQSFASLHDTEVSGEYNINFGECLEFKHSYRFCSTPAAQRGFADVQQTFGRLLVARTV